MMGRLSGRYLMLLVLLPVLVGNVWGADPAVWDILDESYGNAVTNPGRCLSTILIRTCSPLWLRRRPWPMATPR